MTRQAQVLEEKHAPVVTFINGDKVYIPKHFASLTG
jgi:hypothetical protein